MSKDNTPAVLSKSFAESSREVLKFLRSTVDFNLWIITRQNGDDYIILKSEDHGYNTPPGSTFKWCDTFCSRMVSNEGPYYAPNLEDFLTYFQAPFAKIVTVGSYMGVPIRQQDGSLFGTLCALHPTPKEPGLKQYLPMVNTFAKLLGNLLDSEIKAQDEQRHAERAKAESLIDTVTPLYKRHGWDFLTKLEEMRAKEYGHHLCVISINLDDLKKINDVHDYNKDADYIAKAGETIKNTLTTKDIASRTGKDKFTILLVECNDMSADKIIADIRRSFADTHIYASIGVAQFHHLGTIQETMNLADKRMYEDKRTRKTARAA